MNERLQDAENRETAVGPGDAAPTGGPPADAVAEEGHPRYAGRDGRDHPHREYDAFMRVIRR